MMIKEIATRLQHDLGKIVNESHIRFYDKADIIKAKREENNYRKFTEKDYVALRLAMILSDLGFSLEEIDGIVNKRKKGILRCLEADLKQKKKFISMLLEMGF